ncbi:MAG: class I SAM-dependent RNA methyltransferase [Bacteroidales bacterium]
MSEKFAMVAKTITGLEELLAGELTAIGADNVEVSHRAVIFEGDEKLLYQSNYTCRTALRILVPFVSFPVRAEKDFYNRLYEIDWLSVFDPRQTFAIDTVLSDDTFTHSQYVSQLAKDAIVDKFRDQCGRRPSVDLESPDYRFNLHIYGRKCEILFDSSGYSLHKRGYRVMTHDAPLNEVLAAGMIKLSSWDMNSSFVDPMCGSATLPIEAYMAAGNIPAGFYRKEFGFFRWNDFNEPLWDQVKSEADTLKKDVNLVIAGNDNSRKSVYQANENLEKAGLQEKILISQKDFRKFDPPAVPGVVMLNPPYGERIKVENIELLYKDLGDTFKKKYTGYTAWVVSSDIEALKRIGLKPFRRIKVFNGPLECRLFGFNLYEGKKGFDDEVGSENKAE